MDVVNSAWIETCRILLGDEIGNIDEYDSYLSKYLPQLKVKKSAISGQDVAVFEEYGKNAKFIAGNEIETYKKIIEKEKLDINQIKDVDSIVESIEEKIMYAGNIYLGKSENVEFSNRIFDSSFIYKSISSFRCRFMSHTHLIRESEHVFGSIMAAYDYFMIRGHVCFKNSRLFDAVRTYFSSDCYYTINLDGCQNCMFCFNLQNRQNCIGNLELPFDKYNSLKSKLLGDIRETLKSDKTLPTVSEIMGDLV